MELLKRALQEARAQLLAQSEAQKLSTLEGQDEGEKLVGVGAGGAARGGEAGGCGCCAGQWSEEEQWSSPAWYAAIIKSCVQLMPSDGFSRC